MSMIEPATEPRPAPKKRRKTRRKRRAPSTAAPKAVKAVVRFPGLTAKSCCAECSENGCIISGTAFCGHPYKSSISGSDAGLVERTAAAKKQIAHQKIDA